MSDVPQTQPPGWYYAQGDPPGTQRYWDGQRWEGGPQPVPGAGADAVGGRPSNMPEPIMRVGARAIDYAVWLVIWIISQVIFVGSAIAAAASGSPDGVSYLASVFAVLLAVVGISAYEVLLVSTRGQTLGKMALGLKVVTEQGTPPEMKDAIMRILPYFVVGLLSAIIPLFIFLAYLIFLGLIVAGLVFLFTDDRQQTVWDKLAKTMVVSAT